MKDMIKKMVEEMVAQSIKEVMEEMFSTPSVSSAEIEVPKTPKSPKTLSREDFLALSEEVEEVVTPKELDFVVYGTKTAKYNGYVPSDIWTINHLAITKNYGGKWSKKNGGYIFPSSAELRNFLNCYKIKTELDDTDRHNIKVYKAERNKAKAEYYAKLAEK